MTFSVPPTEVKKLKLKFFMISECEAGQNTAKLKIRTKKISWKFNSRGKLSRVETS